MDLPDTTLLFQHLAVALATGLLIGIERGWKTRTLAPGERIAGVRTFAILGLLGGVAAVVGQATGPATLAAALLATAGVLGLNQWASLRRGEDLGSTTLVAALLTLGLGALAGVGLLAVAAAGAVATTLVLGIKPELHGFVARLEKAELLAGIQLLAISVLLLPVLPDRGYGPFDAINPYAIWWMVVLIAGLSFLGYIAVRLAGPRLGVMMTGLVGGFASSTVICMNMARLSRQGADRSADRVLAAAGVAAVATMYPRLLVITAVIAPEPAGLLAWGLLAAALGALAGTALLWRGAARHTGDAESLRPRHPFELSVALEFAIILTVVSLAAQALKAWAGEAGVYALAGAAGLVDVDAIALSFAGAASRGELALPVAAVAIGLAAIANTAVKPALAAALGAPRMALLMLGPLLSGLAAGVLGLWAGGVTARLAAAGGAG